MNSFEKKEPQMFTNGEALKNGRPVMKDEKNDSSKQNNKSDKEITLRWLEEYATQGIITTDCNLCVTGWNRWIEIHSKRSASDVLGKQIFDIFPDLITRKADRYFHQALSGQAVFLSQKLHGYLLPLTHPRGFLTDTFMQQSARIAPLLDENEVVGTITIIDDVSERVMREIELQHQIESLETLHDIGKAILFLDRRECLQRIVNQAASLFRVPTAVVVLQHEGHLKVDAAVGLDIDKANEKIEEENCIARYIIQTAKAVLLDDAQKQAPQQINRAVVRPLALHTRSLVGVPLVVEEEAIGALIIESPELRAFNVGKQRQAMQLATHAAVTIKNAGLFDNLRERERELAEFFEYAVVGIHWINEDGIIKRVNRAETELLGYDQNEIVGQHIYTFHVDEKAAVEMFQRLKHGNTLKDFETQLRHKDGSIRHVLIDGNGIYKNGSFTHARCFVRDITARKLAEEKLNQSEEMLHHSQKMEGIGRLASSVAHDFNNLLTAIIGYSQIVMKKLPPEDASHLALNEIVKAGERSATLTSQLLTFSRKQRIEPKVIDLNLVVKDTNKLLRRLIGEDIELDSRLEDDIDKIKADTGQVCQVIMNLAVNARDAMPAGGKLTIETKKVSFNNKVFAEGVGVEQGDYVMLCIGDTGCGMSKETQSRIFEPFFTTKSEGHGTGLGLATVYGIVKQNGGNIIVESEIGQGTVFRIYFPSAKEVSCEVSKETLREYPSYGEGTILVAEDEEFVRRIAVRVLEDKGYRVLVAKDGAEAVKTAIFHGPKEIDLLFTDMVMPNMGGRELAQNLLELNPNLKVIFTSGYMDTLRVPNCDLKPDEEFLQKPFYPLALIQKVHEVLKPQSGESVLANDKFQKNDNNLQSN